MYFLVWTWHVFLCIFKWWSLMSPLCTYEVDAFLMISCIFVYFKHDCHWHHDMYFLPPVSTNYSIDGSLTVLLNPEGRTKGGEGFRLEIWGLRADAGGLWGGEWRRPDWAGGAWHYGGTACSVTEAMALTWQLSNLLSSWGQVAIGHTVYYRDIITS